MYKEQIVQFLRDTVLLLHSLSQKDKRFQEHFLEVLHQYDQAIPGVRAILKKSQKLNVFEGKLMNELNKAINDLFFLPLTTLHRCLLLWVGFNR